MGLHPRDETTQYTELLPNYRRPSVHSATEIVVNPVSDPVGFVAVSAPCGETWIFSRTEVQLLIDKLGASLK